MKRKRMEDEAAGPSNLGGFEFDVFLSFSGKDTRKGFTGHLYKELDWHGIKAFIDSKDLPKGQRIDELLKHIERSKIFVPIFSQNYAKSKWCLMEIAKMVEINEKAEKERPIIPVFFDVYPTDVKHHRKSFGKAFDNHQKKLDEKKVNEWRHALTRAGGISGYCLPDTDGDEAQLITLICKEVSNLLRKVPFHIHPLIGIDSQLNEVLEMLDRETKVVCLIGICGQGGIGKTTIAMAIYNKLSTKYGGSCFIKDVRENAKHGKGLPELQATLIHDILKEKIDIQDVKQGISLIRQRMRCKKVLLILDDVDDKEQLGAFIAHRNPSKQEEWFGAGSKIIVTTRDKNVLIKHGLEEEEIYAVKELNREYSLQLFSHHAFGNDEPKAEFKDLSMEVVNFTWGLPLALQIFGSLFFGISDEKEWQELLTDLKRVQHKGIHDKLKMSYDSLKKREKCIFLDIACFFIGNDKQFPVDMWEDCGYCPSISLKVLEHKSLISIDDDNNTFRMHDQIRDMGRTIVREEGHFEPQKYSRLWDRKEIETVLEEAEVSELPLTQGMTFWNMGNGHKHLSKEASEAMSSLKMLDNINYRDEDDGPIHLPRNLKYLKLYYGRSDTVRFRNDHLKGLVVLGLSHSRFLETETGNMVLPRLKVLDLTGCEELVRTPDFTHLPCLERLVLDDCSSLEEIDESIKHLKKLVFLSMKGCKSLDWLPEGVGNLKSLKQLDLEGCSGLRRMPDSLRGLENLSELTLEGCKSLEQFPFFRGKVTSLRELYFEDYSLLRLLPDSLGDLKNLSVLSLEGCKSLEQVPNSIGMLESLERLSLDGCESLRGLPDATGDLKNLKKLNLLGCQSLQELPDTIGRLKSLERLNLGSCTSIIRIPDSMGDLKKLCYLSLNGCKSLEEIPDSIGGLESLEELNLESCTSLARIPDSIRDLKKLCFLFLNDCKSLEEIPDSIGGLESLEELKLEGCTLMKEIPASIRYLTSLTHLYLVVCNSLEQFLDSIGCLKSLMELDVDFLREPSSRAFGELHLDFIGDFFQLQRLTLRGLSRLESLPPLPSSLLSINLSDCTALSKISDISNLKVLRELSLTGCKDLTDVPGFESLSSLRWFDLSGCESLGFDLMSRLSQASFKQLNSLYITGSRVVPHLLFGFPVEAVRFIGYGRHIKCNFYLTEASPSGPNFDETSPIDVCFQLMVNGRIVFLKTLQGERAALEIGTHFRFPTSELKCAINDFLGEGHLMIGVSTSYGYELSTGNISFDWFGQEMQCCDIFSQLVLN